MNDGDWEVVKAELRGEMDVMNLKVQHIEKSLEGINQNIRWLVRIVVAAIILRVLEFVLISNIPLP